MPELPFKLWSRSVGLNWTCGLDICFKPGFKIQSEAAFNSSNHLIQRVEATNSQKGLVTLCLFSLRLMEQRLYRRTGTTRLLNLSKRTQFNVSDLKPDTLPQQNLQEHSRLHPPSFSAVMTYRWRTDGSSLWSVSVPSCTLT